MSKLSRTVKRLKGKLKKKQNESTSSVSSTAPFQEGSLLPPEPLQQSQNVASSLPRESRLLCESLPQCTILTYSPEKACETEVTCRTAALQPLANPAVTESTTENQHVDAEVKPSAEDIPQAPEEIVHQLPSAEKASEVKVQHRRAPEPTITAPKPKPTPKTTPRASSSTPKSVSTPKPRPTLKAAPRASDPTLKPALATKPAVQTHAGLYSDFTPIVAQVDQPTPRTLSQARGAALNVLYDNSPAGLRSRALASRSPYSSRPMGSFQTGGALGGGHYSSTGGALGEGAVIKTGGSFGEGSVTQTGGSLGEAMATQNSRVYYKPDKFPEYHPRYTRYSYTAQSKYSPRARASTSTSISPPPPHLPSGVPKFGDLQSYNGWRSPRTSYYDDHPDVFY